MAQGRSLRILAGGLLALALVLLFTFRLQRKMRDFEVYWTAGQRAMAAESLYRASDQHYQFKYLPGFALVAIPLGVLPLVVAKAVWFAVSIGALILLLYLVAREVPDPALPRSWLIGVTFVAMAKFYAHELVLGQINLLFAVMIVVALAALLRASERTAGAWAGAAIVVKPYAFLLVPYLFLVRRFRAGAAAAMATAVALIAPVVGYGVEGTLQLYRDWWRTVTESTVATLTGADAVSVTAMFTKWLGWGSGAQVGSILVLVLLGVAFISVLATRRRVRAPEYLEVALLLTLIPLMTPQGWDYMLLLSTPLVMGLVGVMPRLGGADRVAFVAPLAVVAFSIHDLMGRAAYLTFMSWSVITVCYLLIIGVAVRVRLRGLL